MKRNKICSYKNYFPLIKIFNQFLIYFPFQERLKIASKDRKYGNSTACSSNGMETKPTYCKLKLTDLTYQRQANSVKESSTLV